MTSKASAALSAAIHGHNPIAAASSTDDAGKSKPKPALPPKVDIPVPSAADHASAPKTPADEAIDFFESAPLPGDAPIQVYELKLEEDGGPNKSKAYTRLPPPYRPYILRVTLDAGTPPCKNGVFYTNFPLDGGKFDRSKFVERKLPSIFSKPIQIDLPISHAGAFVYWIEYDAPGKSSTRVKGREGYFNVDPVLTVRKRKAILSDDLKALSPSAGGGAITSEDIKIPMDGLAVLTAVSKWMGPLTEWAPHLREASERGYNMIHWTPLQQRGESKSPYSIADQLAFDEALFEEGWKGTKEEGVKHVAQMMKTAKEEYGLLSLIDVVLNHTANNSAWLVDHPEAGYSPHNSAHLTPALELDDAIMDFSEKVGERGLPTTVTSEADLKTLIDALKEDIKALNLWQYYVIDVISEKEAVKAVLASGTPAPWDGPAVAGKTVVELALILKESGKLENFGAFSKRFCTTVDPAVGASLVSAAFVELKDADALAEAWGRVLDVINVDQYKEWEDDSKVAIDNVFNRLKYTRWDEHGPKLGPITREVPLVDTYFTRLPPSETLPRSALCLANNGWIWDADPLQNFALRPSKAYLRREVIAWGDCVKLRYGDGPQSNPWLWEYMTAYCETLATMFDGFRIDNCHSTPLNIGVYLLDKARVINPNLYVAAELFTGSEETDLMFVSRLGINSLIREAYNGWDTKEFSRLLYRYGLGKPIGSMDAACLTSAADIPSPFAHGPSRPGIVTPLQGSVPHALLFDLTHDNETPLSKRSAEDALSTGALVAFTWAAIGSVKGFDDIYPKHLNIVSDSRKYEVVESGEYKGVAEVKRLLNHLHSEMVLDGFTEGHVHQENDYIVLHRVQPITQKGYLLVAHTAFRKGTKDRGHIDPVKLRRTKAKFIYGASIDIPSYEAPVDTTTLRGLPSTLKQITDFVPKEGVDGDEPFTEIIVPDTFPPGSILVFETQMQGIDPTLDDFCKAGVDAAFGDLDLVDLNVLLHRCDGEEKDATSGEIGAYNVPNSGNLVYCGLEGWMHPLRHIMKFNDLGHPLCGHLREGTWAMDYVHSRLERQATTFPHLVKPAAWFKERFDKIKATVPSFLRPKYFAIVIFEAYKAARRTVMEQCSEFVSNGHAFTQDLALCSVQMYGLVQSASLDPGKPVPSLAAGLPHFASSWARCWGRDVFISLRGLFLTTGNYDAAKQHILAFCSTLKHGLIPNLLDSIRNPRQNIQDYVTMVPDGINILAEPVKRRFPLDDTWIPWNDPQAYSYSSTVAEIIQEILQRHALGINFREHNAGPNLDMQMKDEGFNIEIHVDWTTGIIYGGSPNNCGTWMDKMGESVKAGTKGVPGTPRDGAPIEITGLLKSTLRWVDELASKGQFPFKGVEAQIDGKLQLVTYKEWSDLLQASFEKHYYVPLDPADDAKYEINSALINRRGIYKDVYGTPKDREWSDYQLRCNFPIAMTVAPELFDPEHALEALKIADEVLRAPLGMKTLDPSDSQYRGNYDNSNDSHDASIAKGLNYHQGPEWGWPLGYFLRAYLHFERVKNQDVTDALHRLHAALLVPRKFIQDDPWAGIPELTNENGTYCHDSCRTQAWSSSTLLDFLEDVHQLQKS
ncbi:hypothetical protein FRC04_008152 [Tulasnella sp. 424]|nr:hypothetical protein FRC04_008152 [Tulasnella sp. 424]KAG8974435.1 hypothetical protein FRC05_007234 [Tulasnella sp. 425]